MFEPYVYENVDWSSGNPVAFDETIYRLKAPA